ncbi:receptor-like protein kinase THESEUS 1 [Solanum verrucosum]|uniref:receptor-like protein kinase THESEUS 1 n=1 Tax=Solanum verrucosum TaxID=315347 RepID=UPI0020D08594|nr:receptor-like protein kinase THESEUS 1 [Solanum verrucosum]
MVSLKGLLLFSASIVCFLSFSSLGFASFTPIDCFLISCGGNKSIQVEDGRVFESDFGDSDVVLSTNSLITVSNNENGLLSELHNSARLFTKSSVYSISTKQIGRHWLRLHFYPVKNNEHNLKSAVFSVVANGITLLHEFSFSRLGKKEPLLKEYVIEIGGSSSSGDLVLTLSPVSGSVAFINGIEVVSMPEGQFDFSAVPIPRGPGFVVPSSVALETAYRVNMGGPKLTPRNDTLWRMWNSDHTFLVNPASAQKVSTDPKSVKYPAGESVDIAPNWVYATAQEMADAKVIDQKFNITWTFPVEDGFIYFVRMHFCDFVSLSLNNLIFDVYINNQTAVESLDISTKTMALSAAYFVDFVVNMSTGSNKLFVQVGPSNLRITPANAILNGLEIMKMSNPSSSLDGKFVGYSSDSERSNTKRHVMLIVFASLGSLAGLLLIAASCFLCFVCFHKPKMVKQKSLSWLSFPNHIGISETKISAGSFASTTPSRTLGRIFAFSEIREATKDFDESLVIGVGGFGKVYKGVLENGVMVAVKRGNSKSQQGLVEFRTEIEMLSKLRHRHLVSLIGYCEELNEMILVYEFMAGGPLRKHLYGSDFPHLSWKQRLEICIGAAKGLHYLHTGAAECIIHRDVKTTNILLDENLTAKVADFGLSKFGPALDQTHVSTAVKGSFGYLDPEYYRRQQLTEKSDVYSFGVVLMEVLCARSAINPSLPREQVNIAEWAMHWQKKGQLEHIIDPYLAGKVSIDSLRKYGETAEKCLAEYGVERPSMGDVLWNLEYVLNLQAAARQSLEDENSNAIPDIPYSIPRVESGEADEIDIVSHGESDVTTSSGVFSQIMNPKGR